MRGSLSIAAVTCLAILAGIGCSKTHAYQPSGPLPAGTLMFAFTNSVAGPVELTIDDVRIPVAQNKKKASKLVISGLPAGTHHYFLSSPRDAFGPDHGDVLMPRDSGVFLSNFAQDFKAVLYGKIEPAPPTQGIPGVAARMEP
jgi:hypothetical protein